MPSKSTKLTLLHYLCKCHLAENDDDGFDLIEPSLIQQLRKILDQYPDDDQILKVCDNKSKTQQAL